MFLIITIISILITLNFLLLFFSCNKTTKKVVSKEKVKKIKQKPAVQHTTNQLAPTGS